MAHRESLISKFPWFQANLTNLPEPRRFGDSLIRTQIPLFETPIKSQREKDKANKSKSIIMAREVVCIPAHFMDSGRNTRSTASAVKIQKVFRGFSVRKSVKKIVEIKAEIDEIETRVSSNELFDEIKRDGKEQLKVNEKLMTLLFRLDSVRGVRDLRKVVITKALVLQEIVDGIVSGSSNGGAEVEQTLDEVKEVVYETVEEVEEEDGAREEELVEEDNECEERLVMKRLIEKNDKLMELVTELVQQNAVQSRMISSLSKKVDHLEKVVRSSRRKRKFRSQAAAKEKDPKG